MKKWQAVLWGVGAVTLGASIVGNVLLFKEVRGTKKDAKQDVAQVKEKTAPRKTNGGAKAKSGYRANLPATPILFKRSRWYDNTVILEFESESSLRSATLSVSPNIEFSSWIGGKEIRLNGDFDSGKKYRITLRKGAKNWAGGVLENDIVTEITIPDKSPELAFVTSGTYLPLHGKKLVMPFRTVNCDKVEVSVHKAFENNLNPYIRHHWSGNERMIQVAKKTLRLEAPKNAETYHELDLEELLGGRRPGVYRIDLSYRNLWYATHWQYVSLTDMALQVVEDRRSDKIVVFVRSLATGKPVSGADISVLSFKNQLAASGKTDENGCASLVYDPAWAKESDRTVSVFARKDGDISFFELKNAKNYANDGDWIALNAPRAFVFMERGVARPGEKITASLFLRREQNGTFLPMADTPLTLELAEPSGGKMFETTLRSDRHGFARAEFELPDAAATGNYTVSCRAAGDKSACGRTTIWVANYVPDRIKVTGKSLTEKPGIGDELVFAFDAKYYFGAPLEKGVYQYSILSVPGPRPAHWDKSWSAGDVKCFSAATDFSGKGEMKKGSVTLQYPGFAERMGKSFDPVRIVASLGAAEHGGRTVTAQVAQDLYPTPFFIGVREAEDNGREKRFEYTLLPVAKSDTVQVPGELKVTFELIRREWDYVLTKSNNQWKREWVLREIPLPERRKVVTVPAGEFTVGKIDRIAWDLPSGEYTLTAVSGNDRRTRLDFSWYAGEGGERSANPTILYFRTDAEKVAPGGVLTFSFDALGEGEAFLVYGERTLAGQKTVPVRSGKNTVTMTIPKDLHSSSFFIGCTVVTRHNGNLLRNFGMLKVNVDQSKAHKLQLALTHAEKAEPEAKFPITVSVRDAAGRPQSTAVCLYAVDSGVISLTDYKVPDIFRHFYGEIACPMAFFDMYGLLYEDLKITPDGKIGGDASARKLGKIKQKHSVRLIAPLVEVPASGSTTVTVDLPDHTGELSIFAVASTENAVGSAQSAVIMRKPVTVTISSPRYIAPGDVADLTFTVFNHEAEGSDFNCTVTLPPMLTPLDGASNILTGKGLKKGTQQTLTMKVRAKEIFGAGKIAARLTVGSASAKDDTYITVRSVNVHQAAYRFAVLKPGESFKAKFADDYIGSVTGAIRLSASPALAVKNALDWLNDYPYGCLEQTTAGAFPFLSLPTLVKAGLLDGAVAETNRHKVASAYAKMQAMALSDGSFSMWPNGLRSWEDATVFALHFIFEADKRGLIPLDYAKREKHVQWLRLRANDADPKRRALRAYAVYVLATADDSAFVVPNARDIIERTEKPDFALFLAGGALVKGGYASLGAPAMRDALAARCYQEPNVPTEYSDNVCRLGMTLYILMDCALPDRELPALLAVQLAKSIRPDGSAWGTTQANAWAALGLAAYAEKYPPVPVRTEIVVGDKREQTTIAGVKTLPAKNGTTIVNRSSEMLIVETGIRGIPRRTPPTGGTLTLSREYLNEKGEAVTSVRHGEKVRVRIRFESPAELENIVIADLLPTGLEIEDERLASRAAIMPGTAEVKYGELRPKRLEKRDDRFLFFGDTGRGKGEIVYQTRAVIRGSFAIPPVHAEAMYQPDTNGIFSVESRFTVR